MGHYALVIEKTSTGYSAYSRDGAGCVAAPDTEEETRRNFQEALIAHFELMGQPIPEPSSLTDDAEVPA